jgi:hypothetical protein
MEEAEVGMVPGAMGAATAAICEYAHGYAVPRARGHGFLLKVELEIKKPRGKRGAVLPKARITEWVRTWQEQFGWVDMWNGDFNAEGTKGTEKETRA